MEASFKLHPACLNQSLAVAGENQYHRRMTTLPILYVKPGCPWCDDVIDFLKRKKIEVQTIVVTGDREAMQEMVSLSGQSKAPTMDWDGEVLADFGVEELIPFLKQRGISI